MAHSFRQTVSYLASSVVTGLTSVAVVVLATGYSSMRDTVHKVIGEDTGNKLRTCWNVDKQGEIQTCWRNSGVDGFWLQAGNFFQVRSVSLVRLPVEGLLGSLLFPVTGFANSHD